jgi:hypothetical protein
MNGIQCLSHNKRECKYHDIKWTHLELRGKYNRMYFRARRKEIIAIAEETG